jgi:hypothetical protein
MLATYGSMAAAVQKCIASMISYSMAWSDFSSNAMA